MAALNPMAAAFGGLGGAGNVAAAAAAAAAVAVFGVGGGLQGVELSGRQAPNQAASGHSIHTGQTISMS